MSSGHDITELARARLTKAEIQVAFLVGEGFSTKEIARRLSVSPETINIHRKHIRKKLGITDRSANLYSYLMARHVLPQDSRESHQLDLFPQAQGL